MSVLIRLYVKNQPVLASLLFILLLITSFVWQSGAAKADPKAVGVTVGPQRQRRPAVAGRGVTQAPSGGQVAGAEFVPGEVLVKFKERAKAVELARSPKTEGGVLAPANDRSLASLFERRSVTVGTNYVRQMGTSMSAPHVVGVAALVRSLHPEFSAEQVRQALRVGADDAGASGYDEKFGHGRLNAAGALGVTLPAGGFITLYPSGAQLPTVSNLNYLAGQIIPNAFNVTVGSDGAFNIYTPSQTHFIIDLSGYFAP